MNPALYILCEGERDELFYERLCERLSGFTFSRPEEFRLRNGSNWKTAIAGARLLLERFSRWKTPQQIALLIAIDNDRAPGHPGGRTYPRPFPAHHRQKEPRYAKLQTLVNGKLGSDPATRNVQAVIAMPVEMVESWLLLLLEPSRTEESLPPFAEADSAIAREYYGKEPPAQLKNLREAVRQQRGVDDDALFFDAADTGDLQRLAAASRSFAVFREQAEVLPAVWRQAGADSL